MKVRGNNKHLSHPGGGGKGKKMSITDKLLQFTGNCLSGGEREKLVWTNPSPDKDFTAQKIKLDLADYDEVLVRMGSAKATFIVTKDTPLHANWAINLGNSSALYIAWREITVEDDGITFTDGYIKVYSGAESKGNKYMKPIEIYARKRMGGGTVIE